MQYFSASFYYIRYKVMGNILLETYRNFSLRVWLLSIFIVALFMLHQFVSLFFRGLDEVFFRHYKKVPVTQPVFIIANPRSGTTYLHRLLAQDTKQFVFTKNAHTFFMSSSFVVFYNAVSWVDKHILRGGIRWLMKRFDKLFWGGWGNIHPMAFNKPEEDELLFAQMLLSPGIFIPFPFFHLHNDNMFLDDEPQTIRNSAMDFYESSIKRFLYKEGNGRTYLAKNVMSTARYKTLLQRFPDAKIIYIARHPYEVIPSTASMFTVMYDRSIPKNAPPKKVWAQYALDFFRYSSEMRKTIPAKQFIAVKYDDLMQQPQQTVEKIYSHFNWIMDEPTQHALMQEHSRAKHYKSGHQYSLEEYGFTRVEIKQHLKDEMDAFGFE